MQCQTNSFLKYRQPVQKRTGTKPPFSGEKKREATNQAHEEPRAKEKQV
jgi:hypothetical protein